MLGDSTTFGYGAQGGGCDLRAKLSVPARIADSLTVSAGVRAQAFGWMGLSLPQGDPRLVLGDGWTATDTPKSLGGATIMATRRGAHLSVAPGGAVDSFTVHYIANPGNGTLRLEMAGADCITTAAGEAAALARVCLRAPRATSGPLTVTAATLGAGVYIVGCEAYDSAADEIAVIGAGWQGATSGQVADAREYYSSGNAIRAVAADLTTINLGINDWYNDVPPADYAAHVLACVAAARGSGDVVLFTPTPTNPAVVPGQRQVLYVEAVRRLGRDHAIPLIDLYDRFGSWEAANRAGLMNDDAHPNAAGYADIAAATVGLIFRSWP